MDRWHPEQPSREQYEPRYNYPPNSRLPQPRNPPRGYPPQFPPHPSVRVPPNVRTGGRPPPPGPGVAPRPYHPTGIPRPQQRYPPRRPPNSGQLVDDYTFPQALPQMHHAGRNRYQGPQPGPRYDMHKPYISPARHETTSPKPLPPPTSKANLWPTPPAERYSASVYADTVPNTPEPFDDSRQAFSNSPPSKQQRPYVRDRAQISAGMQARPVIITRPTDLNGRPASDQTAIPSPRTATMNALTAAVATGMSSQTLSSRSATPQPLQSRSQTPIRMPFGAARSPTSPAGQREDLDAPRLLDPARNRSNMQTPTSAKSIHSTNPLLGLGVDQPAMSSKIPANRRPPQLNLEAVKVAESRNSTTSLAELIRRATKVASNLDRGKTASRFGTLGVYRSTDKLGPNRHSTMSDMISAFPAPAAGGTPRRETQWPAGEKDPYAASPAPRRKAKRKEARRCCGMSMPVFITVLIVAVILIAAAILIPLFVVLVPKQHSSQANLATCPTTYPCRNGGTNIVSNNACNCVCSEGFIGSHCDMLGEASDCTTFTISDGSTEYGNATMGSSIVPIFAETVKSFRIPLNASIILSLFAYNNLSCISENQLVGFGAGSFKSKRFFVLPDLQPDIKSEQPDAVMTKTYGALSTSSCGILLKQSIEARANTVGTTNGIVFQATSTSHPATATTGGSSVSTVTSLTGATPTSSNAQSTATSVPAPTDQQVEFAKVVVLYVLQKSNAISVAVNAQQQLQVYFSSGQNSQKTVNVGYGDLKLTADFGKFAIEDGDGTTVGGQSS